MRHDRAAVAISLVGLVGLSWWYLADQALSAGAMNMAAMGEPRLGALTIMWSLMMIAMMLPSTAPAVLLYARIREARDGDPAIARTWVFLIGYFAAWLLFSIAAAFAQKLLTGPSMAVQGRLARGAILLAAGAYQLSPIKSACIRQCRSPAQFLSRYWRPGWRGAVHLGLRHGAYCVGCCWLLMLLLFVGGVMNLFWIAGLTLLVAAERLLPRGEWIARGSGAALALWGTATLLV